MTSPIFVINREIDTERLASFSGTAQKYDQVFEIIKAIDAHADDGALAPYADLIPQLFYNSDIIKPGAIGCFLSHRLAWKKVVETNSPIALICEDDAVLTNKPTQHIKKLPTSFDIAFVNERLVAWGRHFKQGKDPFYLPLATLIDRYVELNQKPHHLGLSRAPGADGYFISNTGAKKLLELTDRDKISAGVDWMMLFWGANTNLYPNNKLSSLPELKILSRQFGTQTAELDIYIAKNNLVKTDDSFESSLKHSVTTSISALKSPST